MVLSKHRFADGGRTGGSAPWGALEEINLKQNVSRGGVLDSETHMCTTGQREHRRSSSLSSRHPGRSLEITIIIRVIRCMNYWVIKLLRIINGIKDVINH